MRQTIKNIYTFSVRKEQGEKRSEKKIPTVHFADKYFCVQTTDTGLSLSWHKLVLLHQPQFPFLNPQYWYLKEVCAQRNDRKYSHGPCCEVSWGTSILTMF